MKKAFFTWEYTAYNAYDEQGYRIKKKGAAWSFEAAQAAAHAAALPGETAVICYNKNFELYKDEVEDTGMGWRTCFGPFEGLAAELSDENLAVLVERYGEELEKYPAR